MKLKLLFIVAVSAFLHYVCTVVFLLEIITAAWDNSERGLKTHEATFANAALRLLSFPLLLLGTRMYKVIPPDNEFYSLAALNSCLWGLGIAMIWKYGVRSGRPLA